MIDQPLIAESDALDARQRRILDDLIFKGWSVYENFFSPEQLTLLRRECEIRWQGGDFRHAGVGRGETLTIRPEVRSDHVCWLDRTLPDTPQQQKYFAELEQLRLAVNRELFLGIFDYEAFFAVYPPGKFYKKHLDRFRGSEERTLTCVLYLNEDWKEEDGGQLRLYLDEAGEKEWVDVLPKAGTLAAFITEGRWHEVLPATRERMSLTGFFRTRT